jgi:hypothetical protein
MPSQLTGKKQTEPSSTKPKVRRNFRLAITCIMLIAIVVGSIVWISYFPNPFVRTAIWISVDSVDFITLCFNECWTTMAVLVTVHNPTHHMYVIWFNGGGILVSHGSFHEHYSVDMRGPLALQSCAPAITKMLAAVPYAIATSSSGLTRPIVIQADLQVVLNGTPFTLKSDAVEFISTTSETIETSTTSANLTVPNECIFPWV